MKTLVAIHGGGESNPLGDPEDVAALFEQSENCNSGAMRRLSSGSLPPEMFDEFRAHYANLAEAVKESAVLSEMIEKILSKIEKAERFNKKYQAARGVRLHPRFPIKYTPLIHHVPEECFEVEGKEPFWKVCFDMTDHEEAWRKLNSK